MSMGRGRTTRKEAYEKKTHIHTQTQTRRACKMEVQHKVKRFELGFFGVSLENPLSETEPSGNVCPLLT